MESKDAVHKIRLSNFMKIFEFESNFHGKWGSQKKLADRLGLSGCQVSNIISGKMPVGETVCRRIEIAYGKLAGWMDVDI